MGDKKRKNKKQRRKNVEGAPPGSSKKGKLPSSVQALLGYLGGGGPSPMYQQPVNLQRERAGVDSIETLSQIIRQQNLMNVSYMQNMERLAFKNEIQDQLKKQGEEQKKEIKEAREEQKQEISRVVVQTQEAIQETTEKSLQQQRTSLMRKIAYERKKVNSKPEKIQSLEEQLGIIDGSIRNKSLADLRSSLQYQSPFAPEAPSYSNLAAAEVSSPGMFNFGEIQQRVGPALFNTPAKVSQAQADDIVKHLPALDKNKDLLQQLQVFEDAMSPAIRQMIEAATRGQKNIKSAQELSRNITRFKNADAPSSFGNPGKFGN